MGEGGSWKIGREEKKGEISKISKSSKLEKTNMMFEFIKKHKIIFTISFIIIILMPIWIDICYSIDLGSGIYQTNIKESDAISYFGSILAFLSTVFLGYLALSQNDNFKKMEEQNRIENEKNNFYKSYLEKLYELSILIDRAGERCLDVIFLLPNENRFSVQGIFNGVILDAGYKAEYINTFLHITIDICDSDKKIKQIDILKEFKTFQVELTELIVKSQKLYSGEGLNQKSESVQESEVFSELRKNVENARDRLKGIIDEMITNVSKAIIY